MAYMNIIEQDSSFNIKGDFTLSSTDQQVLSFLYLPILKADAFSLYQMLYSFSLSKEMGCCFYHEQALSLLGMEMSRFLDARMRLEAIGLLESYRKEDRDSSGKISVSYLYRILPPATPKKFFDDALLRAALSSFVDGKQYMRLKSHFAVNGNDVFSSYQDISTKFNEVFALNVSSSSDCIEDNGLLNLSKSYKKQSDFSIRDLMKKLKGSIYEVALSKEEKDKIQDVCSLYAVTVDEAFDLVVKNTTTDGSFVMKGFLDDVKTLKKYTPMKTDSGSDESQGVSSDSRLIKLYSTISPKKLLSIYFNAEPADFMMKFLLKLKKDCGISDEVLNVALDYSLKNTHYEFHENYIEKVVYSLCSNNVNNCYDAMLFLSNHDYEARRAKNVKKPAVVKAKEETEKAETTEEKRDSTAIDDIAKDFGL